jgi:hypothetical protein
MTDSAFRYSVVTLLIGILLCQTVVLWRDIDASVTPTGGALRGLKGAERLRVLDKIPLVHVSGEIDANITNAPLDVDISNTPIDVQIQN